MECRLVRLLKPAKACSATWAQLVMPKFGSATISSHLNSHQRALAYSICYNQILAIIAEGLNVTTKAKHAVDVHGYL